MPHTAELIAVGTELLLGSIANTDAQMLSQGLSALGLNVFWQMCIRDRSWPVPGTFWTSSSGPPGPSR